MLDPTRPAPNRKFSAIERTAQKAARALAGGDDARRVLRAAECQGTCHRDDHQLAAAGVKRLSALVAKRDYGRTVLCGECLAAATKPAGHWPSVHELKRPRGQYDWRVEVRPYGDPATQEGVTLELWCGDWVPCKTECGELAWRRAEPHLQWNDCWNTLEFQGFHGTVSIWCRRKDAPTKDWTFRAKYAFRGAEHTSAVFEACKLK